VPSASVVEVLGCGSLLLADPSLPLLPCPRLLLTSSEEVEVQQLSAMSRHVVQCPNCLSGVPVLDVQVPASSLVLQALPEPGRLPNPAERDLVGAHLKKMMVPPSGSEL